MLIFIMIYFVLGLIIRLAGPLSKELNTEFMNNAWKKYFGKGWFAISEKPKLNKIIPQEILLTFLFLLLWPVFTFLFIPVYYLRKKEEKELTNDFVYVEEQFFYLDGIKSSGAVGGGTITCRDCSYEEEIVVSEHGRDFNGDFVGYNGFQCQSCGNFHKLRNADSRKKYFCDCGGELSKENKVFCPRCKGENIKYEMGYIT